MRQLWEFVSQKLSVYAKSYQQTQKLMLKSLITKCRANRMRMKCDSNAPAWELSPEIKAIDL